MIANGVFGHYEALLGNMALGAPGWDVYNSTSSTTLADRVVGTEYRLEPGALSDALRVGELLRDTTGNLASGLWTD